MLRFFKLNNRRYGLKLLSLSCKNYKKQAKLPHKFLYCPSCGFSESNSVNSSPTFEPLPETKISTPKVSEYEFPDNPEIVPQRTSTFDIEKDLFEAAPQNSEASTAEGMNSPSPPNIAELDAATPSTIAPIPEAAQTAVLPSSGAWLDSNDPANILHGITSLDSSNLVIHGLNWSFTGIFVASCQLCENALFFTMSTFGLSFVPSLILASTAIKLLFMPFLCYTQIVGIKQKLLDPDLSLMKENMKKHRKDGNRHAELTEKRRMTELRKQHGIYSSLTLLNITQGVVHVAWIALVNRYTFAMGHQYDHLMNQGFMWLTDLSLPDPYGVFPLIATLLSIANVYCTSTTNTNPTMRKWRRIMVAMPLLSLPIWLTFPSAFNLYWIASAFINLVVLNLFRSWRVREYMGIPSFLPGSKLEKMNIIMDKKVFKPQVVLNHKPKATKDKLVKTKGRNE